MMYSYVLLTWVFDLVADTEYAEAAVNVAASAYHVDAESAYVVIMCCCRVGAEYAHAALSLYAPTSCLVGQE